MLSRLIKNLSVIKTQSGPLTTLLLVKNVAVIKKSSKHAKYYYWNKKENFFYIPLIETKIATIANNTIE